MRISETVSRWQALGVGLSLGLLLAAGSAFAQSVEKPALRVDREAQAQIKLLDEKIAAEMKDREWAETAETGVKRAFRLDAARQREWKEALRLEKEPSLDVRSVDCRSTFCRMEIGFDKVAEPQGLLRMIVDSMPWSGEAYFYTEGPKSTKAVVFLAKEGETLPRREPTPDRE